MSILSYLLVCISLATLAISAPTPDTKPLVETNWDVIVVGGGPAGLAALSGLARVNRKALLIDSGSYRNGPTRQMHDVLGFDGVQPAYFRHAAREQILHYKTISMTNGTVQSITEEKSPNANGTLFTVEADLLTTTGDKKGQDMSTADLKPHKLTAKKVILATGLKDDLPTTPGFKKYWGKGIFWCPWCDGHETAGQKLGIVVPLDQAPSMVREILTLNTDIKVFVNGTDTEEMREKTTAREVADGMPKWEDFLAKNNVTLDNRTIASVDLLRGGGIDPDADPSLPSHPHDDLFRVNFTTGEPVERNALFTSYPTSQRSLVGAKAGVTITPKGKMIADMQKGMMTNIKGIYAVGDANSDDSTNVPHAMWSGKKSAVSAHVVLAKEDEVVQMGKREIIDEKQIWERMNVEGDVMHGGKFEE